ncbi:MAG: hypothetical protein MRZ45_02195 [Blautia sp.]|nr:hypothetical protein [Blautia sp.]
MGKHRKISPGDVIDHLEILENLGYRKYCGETTTYWKCRCTKCGNIVEVPQKNLGKAQKDCGCGKHRPRNIIPDGTQFGRLKVIEIGELIPDRGYTYLCECSCEKHTRLYVRGDRLRNGDVQSCGCLHDELFQKNSKKAHDNNYVYDTSANRVLNTKPPKNNTSGYRGVSWHKKTSKWHAALQYRGVIYSLGYYDNIEDAAEAYRIAKNNAINDFSEWYSKHYPEQWERKNKKLRRDAGAE